MEERTPTQARSPAQPRFVLHLDAGFTGTSTPPWRGMDGLQVSAMVRCGWGLLSGWDPDRILQENCVSHLGAYCTSLSREVEGLRPEMNGSQDWDLVLRCAEKLHPEQIRHMPAFLYH